MPNILEIPLEADGEVLTIDLDADLPDDPSEICTLLENENCAVEFWLAFGAAYARMKQVDSALEVVTKGLEAPVAQTEDSKQPLYATLSWLNIHRLNDASPNEKQGVFQQAQDWASKAYTLNRTDATTLLARAVLNLELGEYNEALAPIQTVISDSRDSNVYARFARARILCHRKNWRGALHLYQSILKEVPSPELRPDPRLGIGLCFWKLGDVEHAYAAWSRSLAIEPNPAAQTMLGIYHLRRALEGVDFEVEYRRAIEYMQDAYGSGQAASTSGQSSQTTLAGLTIASYLFSKKNMNHVLKLADAAINTASVPTLISDAWLWKGRVYHSRADYDNALAAYKRATEANPQNLPALLGCGIIEILTDSQEALHTLETAVTTAPKNAQAALLCGIAYYKRAQTDPKRLQRAIQFLEKYISLEKDAPLQPSALLALSHLHEQTNQMPPTRALECIQQAIAIITEDGAADVQLGAALCNNRAVLAYYCGNYDEARAALERALEAPDVQEYQPSISFNLARLEDAAGNPDKARHGYKQVLETWPRYVDAQIRSAFLEVVLGTPDEGDAAMESLMESQARNLEARALQGWYLRRKIRAGKKLDAQEQAHYKTTLMEINKHDTYSLIAMGNMYLLNAKEIREDAGRRDKAYYKASEFFDKALQIDNNNAYAAQGIAIVLAETKRTRQALQILDRACETIQDSTVYLNCGHCLMDLKDYNKAIEMYSVALDRSAGRDVGLFTLLGRAWSAKGNAEKNMDALKRGLEYASQALEAHQASVPLQSNVALLKFQVAELVRKLPADGRSVEMIEDALSLLAEAVTSLYEIAKLKNPPFSPKELEKRAKAGETTVREQLQEALTSQQNYEQTAQFKIEQARKAREEEQSRNEQELKRKREQDEERERELERERLALQEQANEWEEQRAVDRAQTAERDTKKRRKSKRAADDDEFIDNQDGADSDADANNDREPNMRDSGRKNVISDDDDDDDDDGAGPQDEKMQDIDELF